MLCGRIFKIAIVHIFFFKYELDILMMRTLSYNLTFETKIKY